MKQRLIALLVFASLPLVQIASANEPAHEAGGENSGPFAPSYSSKPSKRYSGSVPIDLSHGYIGANGTYGAPDPVYEAKAHAPIFVPGMLAAPSPYSDKKRFTAAYQERLDFYRAAVANLKGTNPSWPEVAAWGKEASGKIESLMSEAIRALSDAEGASSGTWLQAESRARSALVALQGTYTSLTNASEHQPSSAAQEPTDAPAEPNEAPKADH